MILPWNWELLEYEPLKASSPAGLAGVVRRKLEMVGSPIFASLVADEFADRFGVPGDG